MVVETEELKHKMENQEVHIVGVLVPMYGLGGSSN